MFDNVHPWMIPITFFYLLVIPIGISGNVIMILCFFKNPRLRNPFHILLSLTCLADMFHVCGQIFFVYHLLSESTISQSTCFFVNILPIIGLTTAGPLLLQIGLDRIFAVTFPFRYRNCQSQQKIQYTLLHLVFPIVYCSLIMYLGYQERDSEKQVRCAIPTSLNGDSFKVFTLSCHAVYVSIIITYFTTAVLLRMRDASSRFKFAFKSILVSSALLLFGWAITSVSNTFGYYLTSDEQIFELVQIYSGITVNIACSSNLFIFYMINPEYRETIRSILKITPGIPKYIDSSNSGGGGAGAGAGLITNV